MNYRACTRDGLRFVAEDRYVQFGTDQPYAIGVSPRSPDMDGQRTAFTSGEDPGSPAYGTWMIPTVGAIAVMLPGVTWRSLWPVRFAPDGVLYVSGNGTRSTYHRWRDGVLSKPIASGTTSIEGIADFTFQEPHYRPVWQNRAKPLQIDGYSLPLWTKAGAWTYGIQSGTDWSIARDPSGVWRLVTKKTSQVFPCVKEQTDGTLLVAWNGDAESFLWSGDGWPMLTTEPEPPEPPEPKPPEPEPPTFWEPLGSLL